MTLLKIMLDPNVPAATRLRAAEVVLQQGANAAEMEGIEDRHANLECAGSAKKSRKRSADLTWLSATPLPDGAPTLAQVEAPRLENAATGEEVIE